MPKAILDDLVAIKKLDSQNMLASLQLLPQQVAQVVKQAQVVELPTGYRQVERVVVLGMGGSALCAHVVKTLFARELKKSVEIVGDYHLPGYVNNRTLVIASSYSGTTEEVINGVKEAKKKKAKVLVITAGGKLASWAKKEKLPALIFTTENNPCQQPRLGLGYMIFGHLVMWAKAGVIKFSVAEIKTLLKTLTVFDKKFGVLTPTKKNLVKQLAHQVVGKSVWYIASEHLAGNAHVAANQMNETGKRLASYFLIPELNHHLLEGMAHPATNRKRLFFILFASELYDKRVQKRYQITGKVLKKNQIQYYTYRCREKNRVWQVGEVLVLGSYLSYYLALLEGIDPNLVPYVDYFKAQMKK